MIRNFPSIHYVRDRVANGYRFLMVSTTAGNYRGWLFGESVEDLQNFADNHDHREVVVFEVKLTHNGGDKSWKNYLM